MDCAVGLGLQRMPLFLPEMSGHSFPPQTVAGSLNLGYIHTAHVSAGPLTDRDSPAAFVVFPLFSLCTLCFIVIFITTGVSVWPAGVWKLVLLCIFYSIVCVHLCVCVSQGVTPSELDKRYCAPSFHANKPSAITQRVAGCWIIYLVLHRLAKNRQALKVGVGRKTWDWELSAETHAWLHNKIILLNNSFIFLKHMIECGTEGAYRFVSLGNVSSESTIWGTLKTLLSGCVIERRGKYCIMTSMNWMCTRSTICPSENTFRLLALAQDWISHV